MIVPLNWRLSTPELAAILADADAPLLIADAAYAAVATALVAGASRPVSLIRLGHTCRAVARRAPRGRSR